MGDKSGKILKTFQNLLSNHEEKFSWRKQPIVKGVSVCLNQPAYSILFRLPFARECFSNEHCCQRVCFIYFTTAYSILVSLIYINGDFIFTVLFLALPFVQSCTTDAECASPTCNGGHGTPYCHGGECHCHLAHECNDDSDCTCAISGGPFCDNHHCHCHHV